MSDYHIPVMVNEVVEGLLVSPQKRFIDATLGGGGHTRELLRHGAVVLALDQDPEAIAFASSLLQSDGFGPDRLVIRHGNFRNLEEIANANGFTQVNGVLFDLGVSSHQLDDPKRGFSFRFPDTPLDLRMNQREGMDATDLLMRGSEEELYDIFARYGEEERSKKISQAIIKKRKEKPIRNVSDLVDIIHELIPIHTEETKVQARVFQALRIAVNDELNALRSGLAGAVNVVKPGGRIAVLSFHSLEDRIVKQFFEREKVEIITKKPMMANDAEQGMNSRARSAKLRIAQKL